VKLSLPNIGWWNPSPNGRPPPYPSPQGVQPWNGEVVGVNDFYHNNGEGHLLELFLGDLQWIMKNNKHKAWRWWSRNSIQIVMIVKLKDIGLMIVFIHLIGSKHIYKSSFAPRVLKRFLPWHEWRTFFCI